MSIPLNSRAELWAAAACLAAWACLAACNRVDAVPDLPGATDESTLRIQEASQGHYGNLFIGVGNIKRSEYTDEAGAKKTGLTAWLFIANDSGPKNETKINVHPGQKVTAGAYTFLVQEIRKAKRGSVCLQFETTPAPQKTPPPSKP